MCGKCKKEEKIKKDNKEKYTFMSGGLYGDSYVINNKTGKKMSTINFLLR